MKERRRKSVTPIIKAPEKAVDAPVCSSTGPQPDGMFLHYVYLQFYPITLKIKAKTKLFPYFD